MKKHWRTSAVVALVSIGALSACERWVPDLVSVNAEGTGGGNSEVQGATISPDGTKVAFDSYGDDYGPTATGCPNQQCRNVYLRDLATGETTLVSVNATGTNSGNAGSILPTFSPDGTQLAFMSRANDLVATPTMPTTSHLHIYVRDLTTGTTLLVTTDAAGTGPANGPTSYFTFSPDGGSIGWTTTASNLGPTDTNGLDDVYLKNLATGVTTLISANATGTDTGDDRSLGGHGSGPEISPDGTKVYFMSRASDLGPPDHPLRNEDIFVRDVTTGTTSLVTYDATGTSSGSSISLNPILSPDGSKVAFLTASGNLGIPDPGGYDIYVREVANGQLWRLPLAMTDGSLSRAAMDFGPDSSELVFGTWADLSGPATPDTNGVLDPYVFSFETGQYQRITGAGNGESSLPGFNEDGTKIVYQSAASDLVDGPDTNGMDDIFVYDRATEETFLVSLAEDGSDSADGDSTKPAFGHGDRIVFLSYASNLSTPGGRRSHTNVYVAEWREPDA